MTRFHFIEGEPGCCFAVAHGCVAIVVDALRASSTAAMLLDKGATEILVVREVEEALAAKRELPDALLFGERGGLPPEGFDFGNSPRDAEAARGRRVIFTTTTGAGRLVSAWGATAVYMGAAVNASAVARAAMMHRKDVVVIPAGLAADPAFDAQEDRAAAAAIIHNAGPAEICEGAAAYGLWRDRVREEGLSKLFETAPHAEKLRRVGLESDIAYCAQCDITSTAPRGIMRTRYGVLVKGSGDGA